MVEPVKVFVGTAPGMEKAELALEYSIRKHCSVPAEIEWMDYSRGGIWGDWDIGREHDKPYSKEGWSTDFTNFRFAIPEANQFQGRAIYLDVDMILLRDINDFFTHPMDRPIMMTTRGYDVMLFDCAAFKDLDWWPSIEEMKTNGWLLGRYDRLLQEHRFISTNLPLKWDCLDGQGFDPEITGLVHYTNMRTQPWKPYPDVFKYPPHPRQDMVDLFWNTYEEAKEAKKK